MSLLRRHCDSPTMPRVMAGEVTERPVLLLVATQVKGAAGFLRPYTSSTFCGSTSWKCSSSCFSRYQEMEATGKEEARHDRLKLPPLAMKAGEAEGEMVTS